MTLLSNHDRLPTVCPFVSGEKRSNPQSTFPIMNEEEEEEMEKGKEEEETGFPSSLGMELSTYLEGKPSYTYLEGILELETR
jgi:hypothetical protein